MMHPFPNAALGDRTGYIGMTGSGKTYGAMSNGERVMDGGSRLIYIDPLGVAWGLRMMADGKTPSPYEIVIFGGPRADLPVTPLSGALIGETIATMRESAIIDLSQFETAAQERRFMLAMLDALYRKSDGSNPAHVFFDEADLWAPERIMDKEGGDATKLHGMMQTVVRRGRVRGLTSSLISQRPASLSKQVLSQVDGLVAFRLVSPQDRGALGAWVGGQTDKAGAKAILDSLPTLAKGDAVIWLPGHDVLATARFPERKTFDSSRTPKAGEKTRNVKLKPLDVTALTERLATIDAEVKANDPKMLKVEVARLNEELKRARTNITGNITVDPKAAAVAEESGFKRGVAETASAASAAAVEARNVIAEAVRNIQAALNDLDKDLGTVSPTWTPKTVARPTAPKPTPPARSPIAPAASIDKPLQRILNAIRWWNVLGIAAPSQAQAAFIAGYSHKSGTWSTYLSRLRTMEYIDGRGDLQLTPAGWDASHEPETPPSGAALRATVLAKIDGPLVRIMQPLLAAYPGEMTQAEAGDAAGYSHSSGTWSTYLSRLRSLDLIEGRGTIRAQSWLFP